jgi:hypothetical protein
MEIMLTTTKGHRMSETLQTTYAEITSNCVCEIYNESNGESVPSEDCYGCFEETLDDLHDNLVSPWLKEIGADWDSEIVVKGEGMGWRRRAGWTVVTARDIHDALAINGDYLVKYRLIEGKLEAIRYSHDEPTGTGVFTFALYDFDTNEE